MSGSHASAGFTIPLPLYRMTLSEMTPDGKARRLKRVTDRLAPCNDALRKLLLLSLGSGFRFVGPGPGDGLLMAGSWVLRVDGYTRIATITHAPEERGSRLKRRRK